MSLYQRKRSKGFRVHQIMKPQTASGRKKISPGKTNIATFNGKTVELAKTLRKSPIDICVLQETRWCGAKSYHIERERFKNGYNLLNFDSPRTQYAVGIAIPEGFRNAIKDDDRLMKLTG